MTEYCCDEVAEHIRKFGQWRGGSHYHCGNCGEPGGMYGHYHSIHYVDGEWINVDGHFGCSDKCDLRK